MTCVSYIVKVEIEKIGSSVFHGSSSLSSLIGLEVRWNCVAEDV